MEELKLQDCKATQSYYLINVLSTTTMYMSLVIISAERFAISTELCTISAHTDSNTLC